MINNQMSLNAPLNIQNRIHKICCPPSSKWFITKDQSMQYQSSSEWPVWHPEWRTVLNNITDFGSEAESDYKNSLAKNAQSMHTILTELLCNRLPYIINHCKSLDYIMIMQSQSRLKVSLRIASMKQLGWKIYLQKSIMSTVKVFANGRPIEHDWLSRSPCFYDGSKP